MHLHDGQIIDDTDLDLWSQVKAQVAHIGDAIFDHHRKLLAHTQRDLFSHMRTLSNDGVWGVHEVAFLVIPRSSFHRQMLVAWLIDLGQMHWH
jgi:hypothetical protein